MAAMKDLILFINGSMSCKFDYNIHISLTKSNKNIVKSEYKSRNVLCIKLWKNYMINIDLNDFLKRMWIIKYCTIIKCISRHENK